MQKLPICKVCGKNCHINNKLSVHDKCLSEWKRLEKERKREQKERDKCRKKELNKQRKKERKERDKIRDGHVCCICNMPLGDNNKSGYCHPHRNHNPKTKEAKKNYQRRYYY